eukprot:140457-Chlamydomonas_euryale.AAC.3
MTMPVSARRTWGGGPGKLVGERGKRREGEQGGRRFGEGTREDRVCTCKTWISMTTEKKMWRIRAQNMMG